MIAGNVIVMSASVERDKKDEDNKKMITNYGRCTARCKRCKYSTKMGTITSCNYILETGKRRGCEIEGCTKYESKTRKRKVAKKSA